LILFLNKENYNYSIKFLILIKFNQKNIPKDKKLFLGIKSGAKRREVELFWGGFKCF
tara:strand:+ start:239 stop:409 length:171 start_codon:yes stop_codon:yes gene_type:complete